MGTFRIRALKVGYRNLQYRVQNGDLAILEGFVIRRARTASWAESAGIIRNCQPNRAGCVRLSRFHRYDHMSTLFVPPVARVVTHSWRHFGIEDFPIFVVNRSIRRPLFRSTFPLYIIVVVVVVEGRCNNMGYKMAIRRSYSYLLIRNHPLLSLNLYSYTLLESKNQSITITFYLLAQSWASTPESDLKGSRISGLC